MNSLLFGFPKTCRLQHDHEQLNPVLRDHVERKPISSVIVSLEFLRERCTCPRQQRQGGYLGDMEEYFDSEGSGITTRNRRMISPHHFLEDEEHEKHLQSFQGCDGVAEPVELLESIDRDFSLTVAIHALHGNVTIPDLLEILRNICSFLHPNRAC